MDHVAGRQRCSACNQLTAYVLSDEAWHQRRCGLLPKRSGLAAKQSDILGKQSDMAHRETLMRIHIIGGPGSGKTTLARELGAFLGCEVYELDQIAFTGPNYTYRPLAERLADVHLIAQRPTWITEGVFILWIDELLASADIIIWLDHVGWGRSFWHITCRTMAFALQEMKNRRGLAKVTRFRDYARRLQQLIQVFFSSRAYHSNHPSASRGEMETRRRTAAHLMAYKDKVIHCYNDEAVEAFLGYIHCCGH